MSINAVYEDSQGNVQEARMDGVDLTTKISIADDFSALVNYAVGDFCYHLGTLYKCTTAHTAGAWNAAHFTATQVGDELSELKNTIKQETVTVTKESGDTYGTMLARLFSLVDNTKIKATSKLVRGARVYTLVAQSSTLLVFDSALISVSSQYAEIQTIEVSAAPTYGAIVITPAQSTIIHMSDYTSEAAPDAMTIYY